MILEIYWKALPTVGKVSLVLWKFPELPRSFSDFWTVSWFLRKFVELQDNSTNLKKSFGMFWECFINLFPTLSEKFPQLSGKLKLEVSWTSRYGPRAFEKVIWNCRKVSWTARNIPLFFSKILWPFGNLSWDSDEIIFRENTQTFRKCFLHFWEGFWNFRTVLYAFISSF